MRENYIFYLLNAEIYSQENIWENNFKDNNLTNISCKRICICSKVLSTVKLSSVLLKNDNNRHCTIQTFIITSHNPFTSSSTDTFGISISHTSVLVTLSIWVFFISFTSLFALELNHSLHLLLQLLTLFFLLFEKLNFHTGTPKHLWVLFFRDKSFNNFAKTFVWNRNDELESFWKWVIADLVSSESLFQDLHLMIQSLLRLPLLMYLL